MMNINDLSVKQSFSQQFDYKCRMQPAFLAPIPMIDATATKEPAVASALAQPERLAILMNSARRTYTPMGLRWADTRSRTWHARSSSPYIDEVRQIDRSIGQPGGFLLNYSYEWGCTTGAAEDGGGVTLLRTLDWPFDGLGRALIAVRQQGAVGPYLSITWPAFAGVLTGLARGRFAAAINQPPLPLPEWGKAVGWTASRLRVNRARALPPSHLLRLAFDSCYSFSEAVALIRSTPICVPAIFTLAGARPGEAIVIERTETAAFEPADPAAANHWAASPGPKGRPSNESSIKRRVTMAGLIGNSPDWSLDWLRSPILQPDTRLAVMANPRSGALLVQGWEKTGPATALLDIRVEE
jgi:hypothetical protein